MSNRLYILYDSRAWFDPDEAAVYCTANSFQEAKRDAQDFDDAVVYSYKKTHPLSDQRFEFGNS